MGSQTASGDLHRAVADAMALPGWRVRALHLPDGQRCWLKRVETLPLRFRLQKGDPRKALEAEVAGLTALAARGLPVAPVIAAGPDYLVTPDLGPSLAGLLRRGRGDEPELCRAFAAAGRSLARLHGADIAHRRPAIRDVCWDGHDARLIDFERYAPGSVAPRWIAADLLIFVHSYFVARPASTRALEAAMSAYRAEAGGEAIANAGRLARLLAPLGMLAKGVARLRPRARDWHAVAPALAAFRPGGLFGPGGPFGS